MTINMNNGYPKEMVNTENGMIILFNSKGMGTVIDPGNSTYRVNEDLTDIDMDEFVLMGE